MKGWAITGPHCSLCHVVDCTASVTRPPLTSLSACLPVCHMPPCLQVVWQCTVMYFKAAEGVEGAAERLRGLPVLIDYGGKPLWTSAGEWVDHDGGERGYGWWPRCSDGWPPGLRGIRN